MFCDLGFCSYDEFVTQALRAELERTATLTRLPLGPLQMRFFAMYDTVRELNEEIAGMVEVLRAIRTVPMNMRILASRLENAGGPISAISVNYSQMLEEMSTWIKDFSEGPDCTFARIHSAIMKGQFLVCASFLQGTMATRFTEDIKNAENKAALIEDQETLERESGVFRRDAHEALKSIEAEARRLSRSVLDMKRYVTGLSSTRMMCKIESASLANSDTALSGIVEQLDDRQNEIERRLARVVELNSVIQSNTAMLKTVI